MLTQEQLAFLSGVGRRFVSDDLERAKPTVRLREVQRVLEDLGARLELARRVPGEPDEDDG